MMLAAEANLLMLAGGLRVKARVQHPQVKPRKDRAGWPWVFRYWCDEIQPDGAIKTLRKYQAVGPSKGEGAITKKQAEVERDKFLAKLNAPTVETAVTQVATTGVALFGEIAKMYQHGYLGRENQIAKPTRVKEIFYLDKYIVPQVGKVPPQPDSAQSSGGLASHDLRFVVDHAWRPRDHEPNFQSRGGSWFVGGGQAKSGEQG